MLTTGQTGADFKKLNDRAKAVFAEAVAGLALDWREREFPSTPAAEFRALPRGLIGVVKSGFVAILHNKTVVSVLDAGDLLLPDTDFVGEDVEPLLFGSEAGAVVQLVERDKLLDAIEAEPLRLRAVMEAVSLTVSLLMRLNALHIREAVSMGGAPEMFPTGAAIIQQGDPADDIFSMADGEAEVLVNDMVVARVHAGELFGTMAALTGGNRNATVRAVRPCHVIRVPKDRFFELIRSRPAAVQGLLVDMAKSITELNEEVVTLRRRLMER
jgi:CRP/FNR family cyclic AMP-dependent transcriptional regulator